MIKQLVCYMPCQNLLSLHGDLALHTIYKGAIEPILTYGSPVWQEAIGMRKKFKKTPNNTKTSEHKEN